jgi:hypothetical protein
LPPYGQKIDIKSDWGFNNPIMKNTAKLITISVFALVALFIFLSSGEVARIGAAVFSDKGAEYALSIDQKRIPVSTPTPASANVPAAAPTKAPAAAPPANSAANTGAAAASGGKAIQKAFVLGSDSQSEYGVANFDHENHASKNYSPDGKSVLGCVECHHTDQPKSALKPPLSTSERDETLTLAVYQKSSQKVKGCRDCHFQDGNVPEGKTMPTANNKDLNNQLAYHINCNTCHDAAFKLRPDLKAKNKSFATSKDCAVCHKVN